VKFILIFNILFSLLYAFDTRTHVYIAQEVINDLEDGKLNIEPYGEFSVDEAIKNAILENKATYRMGNIGADGFPDVIGGQVTLHPGLEDGYVDDEDTLSKGWKSDDWFKFVLKRASTPNEIAFAYGYIAHGTADTFAHTYVNMYSGDIFDMNDGETDVEKRHILLEKYISDRLPRMKNIEGEEIALAYELVAIDEQLPVTFIKETLIMNDDVAKQYKLSGTASYLDKMYRFREKVEALGIKYAPDTLNPFKTYDEDSYTFTKAWVKKIDSAIDEYIKMSSRMSREFLKATDPDSLTPFATWIKCHADAFTDPTAFISSASSTICVLQEEVELTKEKYQFSLSNFSLLKKLDTLAISSEFDTLKDSLGLEIVALLNVAILDVIVTKDKEASAQSLNAQFAKDDSDKNLLLIDDIAQRVDAEMQVVDGVLNPKEYHVLYNAIILSKLSLLNEDALNLLLSRAGVADKKQFTKNGELFNITFNAIKTIDGNHQWLEIAPPYPKVEGYIDSLWPESRMYGYAHSENFGFALYNNEDVRKKVFNKIFKGPLSLGLEMPSVVNFDTILASDYPYGTCYMNPFPNGVEDTACQEYVASGGKVTDTFAEENISDEETSWFENVFSDISTLFDTSLQIWLDNLLSDLYAYGEELVLSVKSITEEDGSTTVEVITEINEEGITF